MRTGHDNALLHIARRQAASRYIKRGRIWAAACGMAIGLLWYGSAHLAAYLQAVA